MNEAQRAKVSKFLSFLLRHHPEAAGLQLEPGGWVPVDDLLAGARRLGRKLERAHLDAVVAEGDKPRFRVEGDRIRANYGHSVPVDLCLEPASPPETLYHGTARRSLRSIQRSGLRPGRRQLVHLSVDKETARTSGQRHGQAVVLVIEARGLAAEGHPFYRPAAGIWLTPMVPAAYLGFPDA